MPTTPTPDSQLAGVHPTLIEKVGQVLTAMAALGFPMRVTSGVRTDAQQMALYAQGRTALGNIVTRADGVINRSNHQLKADGYGYAVDCAFVTDPFGEKQPWAAYGACAKAVGLKWGGDWKKPDRPHIELLETAA